MFYYKEEVQSLQKDHKNQNVEKYSIKFQIEFIVISP